MKHNSNTCLRLTYHGTHYRIRIESQRYSETIVVSKLVLSCTRLWLILQDNTWRFISDMPLCEAFKKIIIKELTAYFNLGPGQEIKNTEQACLRSGIDVNKLSSSIAIKEGQL